MQVTGRVVTNVFVTASTNTLMAPRGNKGFFHGAPRDFLEEYTGGYLDTPANNKEAFWSKFFPAWDTKYPALDSEELREELAQLQKAYDEDFAETKRLNQLAVSTRGRRKAVLLPLPLMSDRLNELRARSADKAVSAIRINSVLNQQVRPIQKLKSWFSYAKTKDKARKVEPFRAWLTGLKSIHGAPRRLQIAWIIWQHPAHGDSIRLRYKETYKKDADEDHEEEDAEGLDAFVKDGSEGQEDVDEPTRAGLLHRKHQLARTYFAELGEEEKAEVLERREAEFAERRAAYERLLKGEAASTAEELAK